ILFVLATFAVMLTVFRQQEEVRKAEEVRMIRPYINLPFIDFGDPLAVELFRETLDIYHPSQTARNDSIMNAIESYRLRQFTDPARKAGSEDRFSAAGIRRLMGMYIQFIIIYIIVITCTYYGAQTLGLYRYIAMKQRRSSFLQRAREALRRAWGGSVRHYGKAALLCGAAMVKGAAYLVLFSPAYVIAYSFKGTFDTDSYLFMVVLGVISNGLLITYANKFFTLLVHEGRKGYVETAIVKNLRASFFWRRHDGIVPRSVFAVRKRFPGHVLGHIYINARYQYIPTMKEHASFLITGLIIIEMALNIQGHLSYELLQQVLYRHYDVAIAIIAGIFLVVKATEILVDAWYHIESRRLENA
ncbi:MAG: hypothetical protein OEM41_08380, partial [Ignavibacteria bacterium]|nr:hypothetical protein [Ignavibacteria bacterium]